MWEAKQGKCRTTPQYAHPCANHMVAHCIHTWFRLTVDYRTDNGS